MLFSNSRDHQICYMFVDAVCITDVALEQKRPKSIFSKLW